jgi:hypothetical protein
MNANKAIESYVTKGDISALNADERVWLYTRLCERYGFDPLLRPFDVLELKGKVVLYANKGATDAVALRFNVHRAVTVKPHVIAVGDMRVVVCEASATYQGRTETATATLPLVDPVNVLMKCETKAKRRATLAVIGLGILDESEVDTIKGVQLPEPVKVPELEASTKLTVYTQLCLSDARITGPVASRDRSAWEWQCREYAKATGKPLREAATELMESIKKAMTK